MPKPPEFPPQSASSQTNSRARTVSCFILPLISTARRAVAAANCPSAASRLLLWRRRPDAIISAAPRQILQKTGSETHGRQHFTPLEDLALRRSARRLGLASDTQ